MARIYSHRRSSFGNQKKALPIEAMYSAGVSVFSIVAYVVLIGFSVFFAGDSPRLVGGLGIVFYTIAVGSFVFNIGQMRTQTELKDRIICLVISSVVFLIWTGTFIVGMFN